MFNANFLYTDTSKNWIAKAIFGGFCLILLRSLYICLHHSQIDLFDDAYMFSRYAYNVARHGEYAWNVGDRSFGATSVFNTLFLAVFYWLRLDNYVTDKTILLLNTHLWIWLSLFLGYKITGLLSKSSDVAGDILGQTQRNETLNFLFLSASLFPALHLLQANIVNGMDTSLGIFGNTLFIYTLLRYRAKQTVWRLFLAATAAYLTFLMRPDSGIYMLLFPALFLYAIESPMRVIFQFYLVLGLFLVFDSSVKYAYFGYILPLPYYVKKIGFYEGFMGWNIWRTHVFLRTFLMALFVPITVGALFLGRKQLKMAVAFALPIFLTLAYLSTAVQIMGADSRYYMPSLPFLVFGGMLAVDFFRKKTNLPNIVFLWVVALGFEGSMRVVTAYFVRQEARANQEALAYPHSRFGHHFQYGYDNWESSIFVFSSILKKLPSTVVVAASEYGLPAADNKETRILDWAGLHDKRIAFGQGFRASLERYAPDLIWMPHNHYSKQYTLICSDAYFQANYDFYPNALLYGIGIRKNSPYKSQIIAALIEVNPVFWCDVIDE